MQPEPHHRLGNLLLPRDSIIPGEGVHLDENRSPKRRYVVIELCTFHCQGLQGYTSRRGGGSISRVFVPPPHPDPCLSNKEDFRCKEGLNSNVCLIRPSLPILADTRVDSSTEFTVGLLPPPHPPPPPPWRAVTLALIDSQVLSHIQAYLTRSRRGGLGIWLLSFEKSLS